MFKYNSLRLLRLYRRGDPNVRPARAIRRKKKEKMLSLELPLGIQVPSQKVMCSTLLCRCQEGASTF